MSARAAIEADQALGTRLFIEWTGARTRNDPVCSPAFKAIKMFTDARSSGLGGRVTKPVSWRFVLIGAFSIASHAAGSAAEIAATEASPPRPTQSKNYIRLSLPRGVSVELPRNWVAISGHSRQTLDAAAGAFAGKQGELASELPFAANLYDDRRNAIAIFNIRYYPEMDIAQADVRRFTMADIKDLDQELHATMQSAMSGAGLSILSWLGTRRIAAGGKTVLLTEYRRAGLKGSSPFRVSLFSVLDSPRSFTITFSYKEELAVLLKPIRSRVISTVRTLP
jgi:hypothetical protein